jgi:hypothetical protein
VEKRGTGLALTKPAALGITGAVDAGLCGRATKPSACAAVLMW